LLVPTVKSYPVILHLRITDEPKIGQSSDHPDKNPEWISKDMLDFSGRNFHLRDLMYPLI